MVGFWVPYILVYIFPKMPNLQVFVNIYFINSFGGKFVEIDK